MEKCKGTDIIMKCYDTTITYHLDHEDVSIGEMLDGVICCLRGLTFFDSQIFDAMKEYTEGREEC